MQTLTLNERGLEYDRYFLNSDATAYLFCVQADSRVYVYCNGGIRIVMLASDIDKAIAAKQQPSSIPYVIS